MASSLFFFFFNDTATTEIYTLSLHDALPISDRESIAEFFRRIGPKRNPDKILTVAEYLRAVGRLEDRKSTRLNSSHSQISYAVFCLKKKNHSYLLHRLT